MRTVVVRPDGTSLSYMEYVEELRVAWVDTSVGLKWSPYYSTLQCSCWGME
jgi:hypothetical protein